jgi:hypothetical protein
LAELVAALSLGIDLGFGQPMEHVLRQCLIALRLAERIGLDEQARAVVYYTALLVNVGCHSDAHEQAKWFGDDIALKCQGSREFPTCDHGNSSPWEWVWERWVDGVDGVAVGSHAVAIARDREDGGVVQEAVEDRGGDGGVFEDRAPVGDPSVGGQDDAGVFVSVADDLE